MYWWRCLKRYHYTSTKCKYPRSNWTSCWGRIRWWQWRIKWRRRKSHDWCWGIRGRRRRSLRSWFRWWPRIWRGWNLCRWRSRQWGQWRRSRRKWRCSRRGTSWITSIMIYLHNTLIFKKIIYAKNRPGKWKKTEI